MDDSEQRSGRTGALLVALLIGGSAVGVLGWHLSVNRRGPALDMTGFDLKNVDAAARPIASAPSAPSRPTQPKSGIMLQSEGGLRVVDGNEGEFKSGAPAHKSYQGGANDANGGGASANPKDAARASLTTAAHKYEQLVRDYSIKMTKKYPSVRQYGKDWMSYPDLKKLNDDYMRNRDPIAFMVGLAQSKNFPTLVSKYATDPGIHAYVVDGIRQAPGELMSAAGQIMKSDGLFNTVATNVAKSMGLPPSLTAAITGDTGTAKLDQKQIMNDVLNNPQTRRAAATQYSQPQPAPAQQEPQEQPQEPQ